MQFVICPTNETVTTGKAVTTRTLSAGPPLSPNTANAVETKSAANTRDSRAEKAIITFSDGSPPLSVRFTVTRRVSHSGLLARKENGLLLEL